MLNPSVAQAQTPVRTAAVLDTLQMLTGVALISFMWSHMLLVASVNLGAGVMNAIARFLEETYRAQVGGPVIALLFLGHLVLTARKLPFRSDEQVRMWKHSRRFHHSDTSGQCRPDIPKNNRTHKLSNTGRGPACRCLILGGSLLC
jgi:hypothetical protein